jgi:hypothetical protein
MTRDVVESGDRPAADTEAMLMIRAGARVLSDRLETANDFWVESLVEEVYHAMIAAKEERR